MRISDWSSDVCSSDLADAACLRRRQGIAGYAILVASNGGTLKRLIGILAGDAQRPEIDESEMRVSAARYDVGATFLWAAGPGLGIGNDCLCIILYLRLHRFAESHDRRCSV